MKWFRRKPRPTAEPREPARPRPIQGVSVVAGIAVVVVGVGLLAWARPRTLDGQALLASTFEVGELPFGFRVASAAQLPTGERSVVLEPAVLEPEAPLKEVPKEAPKVEGPKLEGPKVEESDGAKAEPTAPATQAPSTSAESVTPASVAAPAAPPKPRFDWTKVPRGESGRPPLRAFIVWYPPATAEAVLRGQFQNAQWSEERFLQEQGGLAGIDMGKLAWNGWDADYVHLRQCEPGGTFRDMIRVNLSAPGIRCALHALWLRGFPASKERVKELVTALRPIVP